MLTRMNDYMTNLWTNAALSLIFNEFYEIYNYDRNLFDWIWREALKKSLVLA